uniref:Leucine-rich repeat-containing protein 4 n=1 Tax=Lygus hesperus TaxID=30085 RepID=A0A0A9WHB9_LYGHE
MGLVHLVLASMVFRATLSGSDNCPQVCACKWKGGKQTVECTDRGLIMIPDGIDSATQVLDLSGNNLQILGREVFVRTGLLNVQRLYLRSSHLGQIDDKALTGLTNLVELALSNNLLTSVPSGIFKDVPFLRDLILAKNPIQKIESHAFQPLPGLVKLDLSNCALQTISPKAFEGVELLEALKLNGNKLRELRPRTVDTISRLNGVELHDNPWYCDCHLREAKLWLMNKVPYTITPMCSGGPERIIHRTFSELDLEDFACKPTIRLDNRHIETGTGDNITLFCRVESTPEASVSWFGNNRILINNSIINSYQRVYIVETGTFEKRSTLTITNAQETDSGEFYCIAENRAGNAEANFTLHVSYRMAGMASLGSTQIVGLSAALVILILFILMIILVLLVRLRRQPYSESKTPGQVEVVANGSVVQKPATPVSVETSTFAEKKEIASNFVQKPPRVMESPDYDMGPVIAPVNPVQFAAPISNPDLINDTREDPRPGSGEYSRVSDGLYPASVWEDGFLGRTPSMDACDRTPIVEQLEDYPPDYGLPIPGGAPPPSAKTLRVWQRGVPVLPPVNALKRVLSRNSPDEGYQEGCGTDV